MQLDRDFLTFLAPGADRLLRLSGLLAARGLEGRVLALGARRHLLLRLGPGAPSTILLAHYDRVEGSPGALDNSAACLVLARVGARLRAAGGGAGLLLLFTDGEEAPGAGSPLSQGSYALARGLREVLGRAHPSIFVFDVLGRGRRLLLSTASRSRSGLPAAAFDGLEARARLAARSAGLGEPLCLPLPWSDDLGFTLAGLPALALSFLPETEAEALRSALEGRPADRLEAAALGAAWPPTWSLLHGPEDGPPLLEEEGLAAAEAFCLALCRSCAGTGTPL